MGFNKKFYLVLCIVVLITLIYINQLISFLGVIGLLVDYNSMSFQIAYYLLAILLSSLSVSFLIKDYIHNSKTSFLVFYFTIIYLTLRLFYKDIIHFESLAYGFCYADLIVFLTLIHTVNLIRVCLKKPMKNNANSFFIEDSEYIDGKIDNEIILQNLIKTTSNMKPEVSFSIGLNAVWGQGKSTFLNRFKDQYSKDNPQDLIFWFKIWKNKGDQAIIENFFQELKDKLKPFSAEVSENINSYVELILRLSNTELHQIITSGITFLEGNETLEKHYQNINKNIKKIDKQIVVLLDDLDRLEQDEILNTLKLIRTLSDFNNMIFIAGYDREYVVETINKPKANFIDKIFNLEIDLLTFDYGSIERELFELVDKNYPIKYGSGDSVSFNYGFKNLFGNNLLSDLTDLSEVNFLDENEYRCKDISIGYKHFLRTYRDVKRFINEFKFLTSATFDIEENLIPEEYILLRLLIYKYRNIQELIFHNIDEVLKKGVLDTTNNKVQFSEYLLNYDVYCVDEDVLKKIRDLLVDNYQEKDIQVIEYVLCKLFRVRDVRFYEKNQNSISKIFYTDSYLRNNMLASDISISKLQNAFSNNNTYKLTLLAFESNSQSRFKTLNEIKLFIYENKLTSKEQFIDVVKSLNIILGNVGLGELNKFLIFIKSNLDSVYKENKADLLNDLTKPLKVVSYGFLDYFFTEMIYQFKRNQSGLYSSDNTFDNVVNLFNEEEFNSIIIVKLRHLIREKKDVQAIIRLFTRFIEGIILDKNILLNKKAAKLIKNDIEANFRFYFESDLFFFLREKVSENDLEFVGFNPHFSLAQIFAKETTQSRLLRSPNQALYDRYYKEGWDAIFHFLISYNKNDLGLNLAQLSKFDKGIGILKAFIDNDCKSLNKEVYINIWGKE